MAFAEQVSAALSAVFGASDTEDEEDGDLQKVAQRLISPEEQREWRLITPVNGLILCRHFLDFSEQEALLRVIDEEKWFPDASHNQAMRFGELPGWATDLSKLIKEAADKEEASFPNKIIEREPLFDQMILNSYQPGEGIKAHVDLLRFEDGIAILSLGSACVMCFRRGEVQRGEGEKAVLLLLLPGDLVVMSGEARYEWTHEINREEGHQVWEGQTIVQDRRVSLTLRRLCPTE